VADRRVQQTEGPPYLRIAGEWVSYSDGEERTIIEEHLGPTFGFTDDGRASWEKWIIARFQRKA
jgi:hypothetical protein